MIKIFVLVLLSEAFTAIGQVLLKKSANEAGQHDFKALDAHLRFLGAVLSRPWIWVGFFAMGIGLFFWVAALAIGNLSIVYPIGSIQYVLILFMAHFFLDEKIDWMKFSGTFLVMFGIVLITIS